MHFLDTSRDLYIFYLLMAYHISEGRIGQGPGLILRINKKAVMANRFRRLLSKFILSTKNNLDSNCTIFMNPSITQKGYWPGQMLFL